MFSGVQKGCAGFVMAGLLAGVLLGTAGCKTDPIFRRNVLIDEKNNGQEITLLLQQTLVIKLASNPSTGYGWQITISGDPCLQNAGNPEYLNDASQPPLPGRGGWEVFRLKVLNRGACKIKLIYCQPWSADPPASSFQVSVVVR